MEEGQTTNPPPSKIEPTNEVEDHKEKFVRDKRRKCALQFGFVGTDYYGVQQNPDVPTVEGELQKAIKSLGIYRPDEHSLGNLGYTRCSRTDKGVSAVALISGIKLPDSLINSNFLDQLNAVLPSNIRVENVSRATSGFNAQKNCESRVYEYLVPIEWLVCGMFKEFEERETEAVEVEAEEVKQHSFPRRLIIRTLEDVQSERAKAISDVEKALKEMKEKNQKAIEMEGKEEERDREEQQVMYDIGCVEAMLKNEEELQSKADMTGYKEAERIYETEIRGKPIGSKEEEEEMREKISKMPGYLRFCVALQKFVGTHNFHNYTVGIGATDPSARRCIMSFTTSLKYFVPSAASAAAGEELQPTQPKWFAVARVHGMSFVTWHIRRMIGASIAVARLRAPLLWLDGSMTRMATGIPTAPGRYLYLVGPMYEQYNKRYPHIAPIPVTNEATEEMRQRIQQEIVDGAEQTVMCGKSFGKKRKEAEPKLKPKSGTKDAEGECETAKEERGEEKEDDEESPIKFTINIDHFNFYERASEIVEQYESMVRHVKQKRVRIAEKLKGREQGGR